MTSGQIDKTSKNSLNAKRWSLKLNKNWDNSWTEFTELKVMTNE